MTRVVQVTRDQVASARALIELAGGDDKVSPIIRQIATAERAAKGSPSKLPAAKPPRRSSSAADQDPRTAASVIDYQNSELLRRFFMPGRIRVRRTGALAAQQPRRSAKPQKDAREPGIRSRAEPPPVAGRRRHR